MRHLDARLFLQIGETLQEITASAGTLLDGRH